MFGIFFFMSLYFQDVKGYSAVGAGIRFVPQTGAIIVVAPLAGRLAGRIGSRWPMAVGLLMAGSGLLLLERTTPSTPYSQLWWIFTVMGVGMGLTMTPMTAAVMSSVPAARAGMASATTNTSREIGGVFGIALLGAIVTGRLTAVLPARLAAIGVPVADRARIVAAATHGAMRSLGSPPGVNPAALRQAVGGAYVTGMHVALVLAGLALLAGSAVAATFVRPAARPTGQPEELAVVAA